MSDLLFQNISTVQSDKQPKPVTIATAATIAPTTFITFVTGSAATVATITPPVSGAHMLCIIFSIGAALNVTGNILNAAVAVSNVPVLFFYNPITGKYTAMV